MDRNIHEKQNLYEWACRHANDEGENCFTAVDKDRESYYEKAGTGYLHEYGFESVVELKALLQKQWEGDPVLNEMEQTVLVAAFKNMTQMDRTEKEFSSREELPTFIYNF